MNEMQAVLCGNPNVGKSTVFNALTGLRQHTGNWAGKTVDSAKGIVKDPSGDWTLIDLPGAYSLCNGSPDEMVTADYLENGQYHAAVVVCDATCLARSLVLVQQVGRLCKNTLVCINLLDEAKKQGTQIDLALLEEKLGLPVVGITARDGKGVDVLKLRIRQLLDTKHKRYTLNNATDKAQKENTEKSQSDVAADYQFAEEVVAACVRKNAKKGNNHKVDRILSRPVIGIFTMLVLLSLVFYLTMFGANEPSEWLGKILFAMEPRLENCFIALKAPEWLTDAVVHGMYRTLAWVIAVMLPPMAIFFPLFTLLEDLGLLPRVAFHADRGFQKCDACGKQALCMCMGLGCNAVGVTGCRIIQSHRERMIAILTNVFTPCNGRLPFLMTLITAFLVAAGNPWMNILATAFLVCFLLAGIGVTFLVSFGLSRTILRGYPSAYVLELPPFRTPKVGQIILRSLLDRTAFVLARAVAVAAPAGLLLWVLGYFHLEGRSLLEYASEFLDPFARIMGMDGVILLAFVLGLPANEIVLPAALMIYMSQNQLIEPMQTETLRTILQNNGWTSLTAVCTALFSIFHWPCATTILTIRKETGSIGWTALAVIMPATVGIILCSAAAAIGRLLMP